MQRMCDPDMIGGATMADADSDGEEQVESNISMMIAGEVSMASPSAGSSPELEIKNDRRSPTVQISKPVMKPWSGPIPKVLRKTVTLSDFLPDNWTLVTRKKKKDRRPPATQRPEPANDRSSVIRADRIVCLNALLGSDGLGVVGRCTGTSETGTSGSGGLPLCGPGLAGLKAQAKPATGERPVEAFVHVIASDHVPSHA